MAQHTSLVAATPPPYPPRRKHSCLCWQPMPLGTLPLLPLSTPTHNHTHAAQAPPPAPPCTSHPRNFNSRSCNFPSVFKSSGSICAFKCKRWAPVLLILTFRKPTPSRTSKSFWKRRKESLRSSFALSPRAKYCVTTRPSLQAHQSKSFWLLGAERVAAIHDFVGRCPPPNRTRGIESRCLRILSICSLACSSCSWWLLSRARTAHTIDICSVFCHTSVRLWFANVPVCSCSAISLSINPSPPPPPFSSLPTDVAFSIVFTCGQG